MKSGHKHGVYATITTKIKLYNCKTFCYFTLLPVVKGHSCQINVFEKQTNMTCMVPTILQNLFSLTFHDKMNHFP